MEISKHLKWSPQNSFRNTHSYLRSRKARYIMSSLLYGKKFEGPSFLCRTWGEIKNSQRTRIYTGFEKKRAKVDAGYQLSEWDWDSHKSGRDIGRNAGRDRRRESKSSGPSSLAFSYVGRKLRCYAHSLAPIFQYLLENMNCCSHTDERKTFVNV